MTDRRPFVLLKDPSSYVACSWDLAEDASGRVHWVEFFIRHFETILSLGVEVERARGREGPAVQKRVEGAREELTTRLREFAARYAEWAREGHRVTILTLDEWRDQVLRRWGWTDPFELLKERENERMLPLLPGLCRELDALGDREQVRAVVEGVLAGNIFDMGAEATAKAFLAGSPDFRAVRGKLQRRPWTIDDYDALEADLLRHLRAGREKGGFGKVVFFVDNAGSDFLLGAVPMMRFFARYGAKVVLVANERPTLNDMTVADVRRWWPRVVKAEPSLGELPIRIVSSGTGEPLIDLSAVSGELNDAAAGADLVVLEGMGRGVESNLEAEFTCKALNIAMLKDEAVARRHGGEVYGCVVRYRG